MREIRYLDKLIDELAKGRPMAKILRTTPGPKSLDDLRPDRNRDGDLRSMRRRLDQIGAFMGCLRGVIPPFKRWDNQGVWRCHRICMRWQLAVHGRHPTGFPRFPVPGVTHSNPTPVMVADATIHGKQALIRRRATRRGLVPTTPPVDVVFRQQDGVGGAGSQRAG